MAKHAIVWSNEALTALDSILEYVFEEWGIHAVMDFQDELEKLIQVIRTNKKLCADSKAIGLRKCVLSRQTSLIYRVATHHLEIVTFSDNRSDHTY